MFPKVLWLTVLAALTGALPAAAQQFVPLPEGTWATDVTPDGEIVVGTANGGGFIWRWRVDPAPTMVPGGDIAGVSDDGTIIAGTVVDAVTGKQTAAIWTATTGWQKLGGLESCDSFLTTAFDISGDGTTIVGLAWKNCSARGFRWTAATGMQELQSLANGNNRCSAISGNGSAMGGFAQAFDRTPAYWSPDTSGTLIDSTKLGEVLGFDETGSRSVGRFGFPTEIHYRAFIRNQSTGAMTNLGSLHPTWDSQAEDLSEDGRIVVGFDSQTFSREAWVWTSTDGMISVNNRLAALGVTGVPPLQVCRAVSDDGSVVVGGGQGSTPFNGIGFIAELPVPKATFVNLGNGLAGIAGVPNLMATGALVPAAPTTIVLTKAKPNGAAALIVGFDAANAPFKQGVLVPQPDVVLAGLPLSPTGAVSLNFPWPAGLPGGLPLFWQMWVADAAAPAGFSASNALQSTTP